MKLSVRVKPNSKVEQVVEDEYGLTLKVREPPVQGKANQAVVRLLASHFGVPESRIRILKGFTSKNKLIEVPDSVSGNPASSTDGRGGQ